MDERHNAALRAMLAEMVDMGYNQAAIGKMLGCGQSHISNIMQGRNGGSVNMALKLAESWVRIQSAWDCLPRLE
jgi:predicted transcriptional regulator